MENTSHENSKSKDGLTTNNSGMNSISIGKKVCIACGAVNDSSSVYCYKCGVKLPTQVDTKVKVIGNPAGF